MKHLFSLAVITALSSTSILLAQETQRGSKAATEAKPAVKPADTKGTVILSGLDNPRAIAIHPGTGELFISESGAGQVVRFNPAGSEKVATPVIVGSPLDTSGQPPMRNVGPLGLAFFGSTLLVGDGGQKTGADLLRFYSLPAAGATTKYEATNATAGPIMAGDESKTGEGNFSAILATSGAAYVTGASDDNAWILKCEISGGKPTTFKPYINTKALVGADNPTAIAMDKGGNLVVGSAGKFDGTNDSQLAFFNPATSKLLLRIDTGLYDIMGLAYSPKTGYLYAVDLAWTKTGEGGLYRLDAMPKSDGSEGVKPIKIATLDKPTALAIAPDGTLYATVMGTFKEGDQIKPGQVVKFSGM